MTWERGREKIERLLAAGELERVTASADVADRLMHDAEAHMTLAAKGTEIDPAGALQLAYDAARKASAALLAVQGLRATTRGGHIAVIDGVRAQFSDPGGIEVFGRIGRLRRRRNTTEYPSMESPGVLADEAEQALALAGEVFEAANRLLRSGRVDEFR